jgi:hypothetical protein
MFLAILLAVCAVSFYIGLYHPVLMLVVVVAALIRPRLLPQKRFPA